MKSYKKLVWIAAVAVIAGAAPQMARADDNAAKTEEKAREKREKAEYKEFPKDVRKELKKQTEGASNVDYFTTGAGDTKMYGAYFDKDGKPMEVQVDHNGKLVSRDEVKASADPNAAQHIRIDQVPAAARKALDAEMRDSKNAEYYRLREGGANVYHATFTDSKGANRELDVSEDGKVLPPDRARTAAAAAAAAAPAGVAPAGAPSGRLQLSELPPGARAKIEQETKGARDVRIYHAMLGHQPCYEAKFTDANGKDSALRVDDNGKVLQDLDLDHGDAKPDSKEPAAKADAANDRVELKDLPKPVQAKVQDETKGAKNVRIYRAMLGSEHVYEVKFTTADNKQESVRIDNSGKVVQRSSDEGAKK